MKLFITGFIQIFFVAINTYFIIQSYYLGSKTEAISGLLIFKIILKELCNYFTLE